MNEQNTKTTPARRPEDGRILARENEEAVLYALHRFGWLPTVQVAAYRWPGSSPRLAQRTLARLREAGEVTTRRGADGATVYALAPAGAKRLRTVIGVLDARPLPDLDIRVARNYYHRRTANDVCLWWPQSGLERVVRYETEHEIATRRAVFSKADGVLFGSSKVPDALLYMRPPENHPLDDDYWVGWVEAEGGHKNSEKQLHMARSIAGLIGRSGGAEGSQHVERRVDPEGRMRQYRVMFALVACVSDAQEVRLARSMLGVLYGERWRDYNSTNALRNTFIWRPEGKLQTLEAYVEASTAMKALQSQLVRRR